MARLPVPAIVTAMNVNGLAVARALGRHGVRVFGIHENSTDPETRSRHLAELWTRDAGADALIRLLLEKGPTFDDKPVLFAITDESVVAIAENLEALREHYRVPMTDPATVLRLVDKQGFDECARELELPVPGTWIIDSPAALDAVAAEIPYPCIMKPQEESAAYAAAGGKKAYILEDADSLRSAYREFCDAEPRVVVQQFVPGTDADVHFCLQAWCGGDEPLASFAGRKLRQWRPGCGGTSAAEPLDAPELERLTSDFFRAVGMEGPCSMEFKRDPRDGRYYMIEPTVCRPDWQNGVADANGVPIVWFTYSAAVEMPVPMARRKRLRRRWVLFGADRLSAHHYRQRGELGRIAWLWSIRPLVRGAYFALDDPRPYLAILSKTLKRVLAKLGIGRGKTS